MADHRPEGNAATGAGAAGDGGVIDGGYAWFRVLVGLVLSSIGAVGFWSVVVVLPAVEAEFRVARADASLPYSATMIGFAIGGILMGRMVDRIGIVLPVIFGSSMVSLGYFAAAHAGSLWQFTLAQGLMIGLLGSSATFAPLLADISHWFRRQRGIAVSIVASGNYIAGTVWPPILQHLTAAHGWRTTYLVVAAVCACTMVPLALLLRGKPPREETAAAPGQHEPGTTAVGLSPNALQALLILAGLSCCVAMSMPQVHIVAYCSDLGYGVARGAELLSVMLGFGVISRIATGFIADRIGGVRAMLLGSVLQLIALAAYLPSDGLMTLYVVSAFFGLAQGGIVPCYAIIVREMFSPREAATRVGIVIMSTIVGMALGGWMSGLIYDVTGTYTAAFLNGIAWNVLNAGIGIWLLLALRRGGPRSAPATA
jgi:MFS family permease